jgi:OTU domain-containing protein 3
MGKGKSAKRAHGPGGRAGARNQTDGKDGNQQQRGRRRRDRDEGWTSTASGDEIRTLETQLRALSLERTTVEADGNCFFRSLADQKYGDESRHAELRERIVAYVAERKEEFGPFVEDDETFEDYVERMGQDGEWAGHLEVCAATAVLRVGVCIHQAGSPRWVAGAEASDDYARTFHVSYEGSDHYNSVRIKGARRDLPGGPLCVAVLRDADLTEVCRRTGCSDFERLRRTLRACRNDVDVCVDTIEEELEEESRAREQAIEDGIDVEEFDGGEWAEVKTKSQNKKGRQQGGRRRERSVENLEMESLRI